MPALTFGANTTDRVTQTAPAIGSKYTWLMWVYIMTITNLRALWSSRIDVTNSSVFNIKIRTGGDVQLVFTGSPSGDYRTSTTPLASVNNWRRVAVVFDVSLSTPNQVKFFTGNENANAALVTNATSLATNGTPSTQTGTDTLWGNSTIASAFSQAIQGRMAEVATFPDALTIAQCFSWFQTPRNNVDGILASDFKRLGNESAGNQQDYSGHGLTGTTTGATQSAGPPRYQFSAASQLYLRAA